MRQRHQRLMRVPIEQAEPTAAQYRPQVEAHLAEVEEDPQLWWRLNLELMATTAGISSVDEHQPDIQKMPGWLAASPELRQRIIRTAVVYLFVGEPNDDHWFGKSEIRYRPAQAGYRALYLLCQLLPDFLDQLPTAATNKWALSVIAAYTWTFPIVLDIDRKLLLFFAQRATDGYVAAGVRALQTTTSSSDLNTIADRLSVGWHAEFSAALWHQLEQHPDNLEYLQKLLPYLIQHDTEAAQSYILNYLLRFTIETPQLGEVALSAAISLMYHASDAGWPILWPVIQAQTDFGKKLFLQSASELAFHSPPFAGRLDLPEIAALYQWLLIHFPYTDDPPIPKGSYTPTPYHDVCRLRDALLTTLVNTGTKEAVDAIGEIVSQNPTIPDRERYLFVAQEQWRRRSWQPIQPAQLLELIHAKTSSATSIFDQRNQNVSMQINLNIERFGL